MQVDRRRVTADARQGVLQRHVEVDVDQTVLATPGRVDLGAALNNLAILGGREADTGDGRGVGGVEGQDAILALTRNRHVGDDGSLRVQNDAVADGLGRGRRAVGRGLDRQRVAPVRQLGAVRRVAVEPGVTARRRVLDRAWRARVHVVDGPIRAPAREGADRLPGLVPKGVGQRGNGAQQDRARGDDGAGVLLCGARDDEEVGVDPVDHPLILNVEGALLTKGQAAAHERRPVSADVVVRRDKVEDRRRTPGAVEAHVGDGEVRSAVGARKGDRAVDERALGRVLRCVRGESLARGHGDGHGGSSLGGHGH